jgi:hypothetical protein
MSRSQTSSQPGSAALDVRHRLGWIVYKLTVYALLCLAGLGAGYFAFNRGSGGIGSLLIYRSYSFGGG